MKFEIRVLLAILLGSVVDMYSHVYLFPLIGKAQTNIVIRYLLSTSTFVIVGIIIWKLTANLKKEHSSLIVKGGLIGAFAGFLIGFVRPILLQPGNPQGPLLGIFFTIPIGFVIGLLGGVWYGSRKYRNS